MIQQTWTQSRNAHHIRQIGSFFMLGNVGKILDFRGWLGKVLGKVFDPFSCACLNLSKNITGNDKDLQGKVEDGRYVDGRCV
jgi:hypothetical protein